jgi:hypothetical protein
MIMEKENESWPNDESTRPMYRWRKNGSKRNDKNEVIVQYYKCSSDETACSATFGFDSVEQEVASFKGSHNHSREATIILPIPSHS